MTFRLIHENWSDEFLHARAQNPTSLLLISPFIKLRAIQKVIGTCGDCKIRAITRFNKADFSEGISDIAALRFLLEQNAEIRGIKGLHSKVYVFGNREAFVTSANMTHSALHRNFEFGCHSNEPTMVAECMRYFDFLWNRSGSSLLPSQLDRWELEVQAVNISYHVGRQFTIEDEGVDLGLDSGATVPIRFEDAPAGYVKFFGTASTRASKSQRTIETIIDSGSHWACTYPISKRPTSVPDGACFFMARMVKEPIDFKIFGRAVGMKHVPSRDEATIQDISVRPWKETWPLYIRVHSGEYLGGTLGNCVSLYELLDDFGVNSLLSTQRNKKLGTGNTDPRLSVRQQAHVRLTNAACSELNRRLQFAFDRFGMIPRVEIDELDKPFVPDS